MDLRDVLLFFHIVGASAWLGANVVQMAAPSLAFAQGAATAAGWMRMTVGFARRIYMPASVVVLLTGVGLVMESDVFTFGHKFVGVGFAMIVIGAILGALVFGPGGERAAQAIESEDQTEIVSATSRLARFGALDMVLLLFTFAVMVLRWN